MIIHMIIFFKYRFYFKLINNIFLTTYQDQYIKENLFVNNVIKYVLDNIVLKMQSL